MTTTRPWYQIAARSFRRRWVQVIGVALGGLFVLAVANLALAPAARTGATSAKEAAKFKFLHCDKCMTEMSYNHELDGKPCPRCPPPHTGFYMGTESSVKASGGGGSPWRWFNLAAAIDLLATLGGVVYLLSLPVPDPATTYYVHSCQYCNQRMRFRKPSLGQIGVCPRCKRPQRFPAEEEAVLETDLLRQEEAAMDEEREDGSAA